MGWNDVSGAIISCSWTCRLDRDPRTCCHTCCPGSACHTLERYIALHEECLSDPLTFALKSPRLGGLEGLEDQPHFAIVKDSRCLGLGLC